MIIHKLNRQTYRHIKYKVAGLPQQITSLLTNIQKVILRTSKLYLFTNIQKARNYPKSSKLSQKRQGLLPATLINLFLLPGKIDVVTNLGIFYDQIRQTDKAVKNLETALEQARSFYHEKPHVILAEILHSLGKVLDNTGKSQESLTYFEEAKKVMDQILGPDHAHPVTSSILYYMGTSYLMLNDLFKALQCFKDAFNMNSVLYGERGENGENGSCGNMEGVCLNLAFTAELLGIFSLAREYYTKAVNIKRRYAFAKNTCSSVNYAFDVVYCLYRLGAACEVLGERDEALKHLEEARKISKDAPFKDWVVVNVFVQLIKKYAKMGSIIKSIMCYLEAGEMAKSLPKDDSLPPSTLDMLKLMKI